MTQIKEKYDKGIASSLDLSDATIGLKVAEFNKVQTIYDYILAKARFESRPHQERLWNGCPCMPSRSYVRTQFWDGENKFGWDGECTDGYCRYWRRSEGTNGHDRG
jgi:hypothetical protein